MTARDPSTQINLLYGDWGDPEMFMEQEELNEYYERQKKSHAKNINADFYTSKELREIGIECGENCLVHKTCVIVRPYRIKLGSNVRIDAFCTLSASQDTGKIEIENNVHIAGYVTLMGGSGILIRSYAALAAGVKVYSQSDDIMGRGLVGPCVADCHRHLHKGLVVIGQHCVVAVSSILMPRTHMAEGSVLLPFSLLVNTETKAFTIYAGNPAKEIKARRAEMKLYLAGLK